MRLDRANRSFLAFVTVAVLFGATVLCGAIGGVLVPLSLARISHGGLPELWRDRGSLLAPLVLFVLIAVGLGLGARALGRQALASRVLSRRVLALASTAPEALAQAARQTGLAGRVVLVDAPDSFSFVYGLLTPRVAVSRGLLERTTDDELRAVLEHERYHVCNIDPLKSAIVRVLSEALFFFPALDSLRARYVASRELAADRRALALCGRRPLAGALLKVVRGPLWSEQAGAAALSSPELLDVRLRQLETGSEPRPDTLDAEKVILSLAGSAMFALVFLVSVSCLGGAAAVYHATGTGLMTATGLDALTCTAPFAVAGLLIYSLVAMRARRPLRR
ncbi:MAG TPA: M56 family metallopeptidase [Solirubrobacteraceae bacterium]|jgi:Zn-dependent protease with chaperone function